MYLFIYLFIYLRHLDRSSQVSKRFKAGNYVPFSIEVYGFFNFHCQLVQRRDRRRRLRLIVLIREN